MRLCVQDLLLSLPGQGQRCAGRPLLRIEAVEESFHSPFDTIAKHLWPTGSSEEGRHEWQQQRKREVQEQRQQQRKREVQEQRQQATAEVYTASLRAPLGKECLPLLASGDDCTNLSWLAFELGWVRRLRGAAFHPLKRTDATSLAPPHSQG